MLASYKTLKKKYNFSGIILPNETIRKIFNGDHEGLDVNNSMVLLCMGYYHEKVTKNYNLAEELDNNNVKIMKKIEQFYRNSKNDYEKSNKYLNKICKQKYDKENTQKRSKQEELKRYEKLKEIIENEYYFNDDIDDLFGQNIFDVFDELEMDRHFNCTNGGIWK